MTAEHASTPSAPDGPYRPIDILLIFGAPLLTTLTVSAWMNQNSWIDPYIYAGYLHDLEQTIARFDQTYFSSRLSYILYDKLFLTLLGPVEGYLAARYIALCAATAALAAIARRFGGTPTTIIATAWLCFIPWLTRSLAWTHYDGVAMTYLLIALAFLIAPRRSGLWTHAAAGAAGALAVNSQIFLLGVGGAFFPCWLMMHAQRDRGWLLRRLGAILAGFFIVYVVLVLIYAHLLGRMNALLDDETFNTARKVLAGGAREWFVSILDFPAKAIWIPAIPLLMAALALICWRRLRHSPAAQTVALPRHAIFAMLALSVYAAVHFTSKAPMLGLIYYTIYLLPAAALCLISICAIGEATAPKTMQASAIVIALGLALFWLANGPVFGPLALQPWMLATLIAAALALTALAPRHMVAAIAAISAASLTALLVSSNKPGMHHLRGPLAEARVEQEWRVYRGAIALQRFTREAAPLTQKIGLWGPQGASETALASVRSMLLAAYSDVAFRAGVAYPNVNADLLRAIRERENLCLIAQTPQEIEQGLAALRAAGLGVEPVRDMRFEEGGWGYSALMLRLVR